MAKEIRYNLGVPGQIGVVHCKDGNADLENWKMGTDYLY
jgi:hypothetical protein